MSSCRGWGRTPEPSVHGVCGEKAAASGLSVVGQGVAEEKRVWLDVYLRLLHRLRLPGPGGAKAHPSEELRVGDWQLAQSHWA